MASLDQARRNQNLVSRGDAQRLTYLGESCETSWQRVGKTTQIPCSLVKGKIQGETPTYPTIMDSASTKSRTGQVSLHLFFWREIRDIRPNRREPMVSKNIEIKWQQANRLSDTTNAKTAWRLGEEEAYWILDATW